MRHQTCGRIPIRRDAPAFLLGFRILSVKFSLTILLVVCVAAHAQTAPRAPRPSATREHFRWSERLAHELDYKHTVGNANDLTQFEKNSIIQFISHQMARDGDTEDMSGPMTARRIRKFVESVRVEVVDLKGDGTREVLAQAPWIPLCGATGNCSFWVFEFVGDRMRVILDDGKFGNGFEEVIVRPCLRTGTRTLSWGRTFPRVSERWMSINIETEYIGWQPAMGQR